LLRRKDANIVIATHYHPLYAQHRQQQKNYFKLLPYVYCRNHDAVNVTAKTRECPTVCLVLIMLACTLFPKPTHEYFGLCAFIA
jgi:hypothetical protein